MDNLFTVNVFEPLLWLGCAYVVLRIVHRGNQKLWLWVGIWSGLGLLNKHSMLIFGFGVVVGLILTRERCFGSRWFWHGALVALLIFLPNLIWNIQHHFPFLELQENIRQDGRNVHLGPWTFFYQEMRSMLPLTLPTWLGGLGRRFASEFGWEEMVDTVAGVYLSLPPEVRGKTAIFAQNFGQAGAIDLLGKKFGLPDAIGGHQNYFLWGPREYTGESLIVMQGRQEKLDQVYASCEKRAHVSHPYSMPREHFDVYYCRGLKMPLKEMWPMVKNWH